MAFTLQVVSHLLPALEPSTDTNAATTGKGEVRIVSQKAEPFRIDGLWGNNAAGGGVVLEEKMIVES